MTEEIARLKVGIEFDDREYTDGTKRAEKATDKVDQKTKELSADMQKVGSTAEKAGSKIEKACEKAGTKVDKLKSSIQNVTTAIGGIGAIGIGGMTLGAAGKAIMDASASQADVMKQFAVAAGGDKTKIDAIDKLYRDINKRTPLENEKVGGIAAQIVRNFGGLDDTAQRQLASRVIAAGEMGEDTSLILKSLAKLSATNKSTDVVGLLDQIAGTSGRTGYGIAATSANLAALAPAAGKNYVSTDALQQYMIAAAQKGMDASEAATLISEGLTSIKQPAPIGLLSSENQLWQTAFGGLPKASRPEVASWDISGDALYPTEEARFSRGEQTLGKNVWNALGTAKNDLFSRIAQIPANADKIYAYNQTEMDRASVIINQYFTGSDSPTVAAMRGEEQAAARWAQK